MINYYNGDLLTCKCDIIAHQVNLQGIMGDGLARQIVKKYPQSQVDLLEYVEYYNKHNILLIGGVSNIYKYGEHRIANCFSQNENFETDYNAICDCFSYLLGVCRRYGYKSIGVPKNFGCGIAIGEWKQVEKIFNSIFMNETDVELQIWELKKENK